MSALLPSCSESASDAASVAPNAVELSLRAALRRLLLLESGAAATVEEEEARGARGVALVALVLRRPVFSLSRAWDIGAKEPRRLDALVRWAAVERGRGWAADAAPACESAPRAAMAKPPLFQAPTS